MNPNDVITVISLGTVVRMPDEALADDIGMIKSAPFSLLSTGHTTNGRTAQYHTSPHYTYHLSQRGVRPR
jgi:hypothetical protein